MQLDRLLFLVHEKNQLNAKRRRFYMLKRDIALLENYLSMTLEQRKKSPYHKPYWSRREQLSPLPRVIKSFTYEYCLDEYIKAQKAAKALTPELRRLRKECGIKFKWDDSGYMKFIIFPNGDKRHRKTLTTAHLSYLFEQQVLQGE